MQRSIVVFGFKVIMLSAIVMILQLLNVKFGLTDYSARPDTAHEFTVPRCDAIVRINPDVLYFGDSTLSPVPLDRDDPRFTSEILDVLLPQYRVEGFQGGALTPEIFAESLDYFFRRGCRPKVVIVPINVRVFSESWRSHPSVQFVKMRRFLKHDSIWFRAFYRPMESSGVFDSELLTNAEFSMILRRQVDTNPAYAAYAASSPQENTLEQLGKFTSYGVPIDEHNPVFSSLIAIRETATRMEAHLLCYITPVDVQHVEAQLGVGAANVTRENLAFLEGWLQGHDFEFLNLSEEAVPEHAFPIGITSSHLTVAGRRHVAGRLSEFIQARGILDNR